MTRIRAASLVALAIFLAGCVTPSGIVDNFVPPQGQPPVVATLQMPTCEEAVAKDPVGGKVETIAPCVAEVITIAARRTGNVVGPITQKRPGPPRIGRPR